MASDLYKISTVSPQQRDVTASPLATMVTEKGDKGGTKCVAGPGSHLALLTTIPWVLQGPLVSGGLRTCPFAVKQALIPQNTNRELLLV